MLLNNTICVDKVQETYKNMEYVIYDIPIYYTKKKAKLQVKIIYNII